MIVCAQQPGSRAIPHSTCQRSGPCRLRDCLHAWSVAGCISCDRVGCNILFNSLGVVISCHVLQAAAVGLD
jgi:hypothetical protein